MTQHIYPDKNVFRKDACTLLFRAALFTTAKTWKQLKCPSTDERIKKTWYIYTMKYYLLLPVCAIKKNDIMPFAATWMDLRDFHTKWSQKDKYHMISLIVESKIWHKWTYLGNRSRHMDIKNRLVVAKGDMGWGRYGLGVWDLQMQTTILHIKWINNKVLLYSPRNCIKYPVINYNGK